VGAARCKEEARRHAPAVEGAQGDLVKTEAMKILRESLGTKSGARKKVIERGPTISTSTTQDFRGDTERRGQGMSSREPILTRDNSRRERELTGRSRN
jgi:hypothetical protein